MANLDIDPAQRGASHTKPDMDRVMEQETFGKYIEEHCQANKFTVPSPASEWKIYGHMVRQVSINMGREEYPYTEDDTTMLDGGHGDDYWKKLREHGIVLDPRFGFEVHEEDPATGESHFHAFYVCLPNDYEAALLAAYPEDVRAQIMANLDSNIGNQVRTAEVLINNSPGRIKKKDEQIEAEQAARAQKAPKLTDERLQQLVEERDAQATFLSDFSQIREHTLRAAELLHAELSREVQASSQEGDPSQRMPSEGIIFDGHQQQPDAAI